MKENRFIIISVLSVIGIACVFGVYYIFNFREIDIRKVKTEARITTNELFEDFNSEKEASFDKYIEKAIEIEGILYQVTHKGDIYSLLLRGEKIETLVLCEMQKNQAPIIMTLKIGD